MNAAAFTTGSCYGCNVLLAKPVLHKIDMKVTSQATAHATPLFNVTLGCACSLLASRDPLERKMKAHERTAASPSSFENNSKDKTVRTWQHIISQSYAPQSAGGLARR